MSSLGSLLAGNVPVLIMMLVGVGLLVFEMYIPGFGVPGISGIALLVVGFVLLGPTLAQGLVLFALCCSMSYMLSGHFSLYTAQRLEQDKFHLE